MNCKGTVSNVFADAISTVFCIFCIRCVVLVSHNIIVICLSPVSGEAE